ncbi:MAG TPA: class I SAM-dependent methyltransferase [Solirubrobacteraceae bacterium]|nr:class I SAM-dependent methyltransferase [Solirubrobacteraceae bacterium]
MIKSYLRRLSPSLQDRLRRLSRLRWLEKARLTRYYGASFRARPWQVAKYVLWAPDVGDFSYELDNGDELVEFLASVLALEPAQVRGYLDEIRLAPELTGGLAATVRPRLDMSRHPGLGHRVAWYVIARARKPRLIVETGIKHGIGSLVLLVALERNAREGSGGRLVSFDPDPASGWVVPSALRAGWQPVFETSFDAFDRTLEGERIDLFICDTPPDREIESFEMRAALDHAAPDIVLIAGNGDRTTVLPDLVAERGGRFHFFAERPRHAIYPGGGLGLALEVQV